MRAMSTSPEATASDAPVRIWDEGAVRIVAINRPARRNAVDADTAARLLAAFETFEADESASVAVLTGIGGSFCAGADLKALAEGDRRPVRDDGPGPMGPTRLRLGKPVIAAIEGPAVAGGLELALWCDLRIASQDSALGFPERRWGVPLVDGGTQRLPRIVGLGRALDLILTGRIVDAGEALAMGLLTEVVPAGRHLERALEFAEALARFPQDTMLADRRAAIEGIGLTFEEGLALEAANGVPTQATAWAGAARFSGGEGRGGTGAGV
jgi:enoyl-CoA hydratase